MENRIRCIALVAALAALGGSAWAQEDEFQPLDTPPSAPVTVPFAESLGAPVHACRGEKPQSCGENRVAACRRGWWTCIWDQGVCKAPQPDCKDGDVLRCANGQWRCRTLCDSKLRSAVKCGDGERPACRDGQWKCVDNCVGAKPTCAKGDRVACRNYRWTCLDVPDKGKVCPAVHAVCKHGTASCRDGQWICPNPEKPRDTQKAEQGSGSTEPDGGAPPKPKPKRARGS